ncbi:DUF6522 family protein [Pseudorhodoplanes sp.]|jgi:hypothetical protein|uniref:DUF6522 family protein n=1 Tax=Pseudorhodoplanes sp. TaxID=1934341 RepID=UPI002D17420A|nr:DUF6522 family protein [Pseudorhodoplanes sp.]HWV55097.1 DUF6522 family protein [Pseudorhodoplanes sp.]
MIASRSAIGRRETPIERDGNGFTLDAALIGELIDVPPADVPALMRSKSITCMCESGIDSDRGTFRINLFYHGRHVRLRIGSEDEILQRSTIDFGERPQRRRRSL